MDRHAVSPLDPFRTFLVGGGLLVPYSLSGSPVITTHANGYYDAWPGWVVSISVLPLTGTVREYVLILNYFFFKFTFIKNISLEYG